MRSIHGPTVLASVSVLIALVGVLLWAPWSASETASKWDPTVTALCDATQRAKQGQFPAARVAFHDRVHAALHELAADVAERHRSVAARLLEAKEQVEAVIDAPQSPDLSGRLRRLTAQTRAAATILGEPVGVSCGAVQ